MDTVLGVAVAPTTVRMVLLEGENADAVTVDAANFELPSNGEPATVRASDQVVSAILGTRQGAAEACYQLLSTGVAWRDQDQALALRDALAARRIENVMLVSAFLAAAALVQAMGYANTALLYVEPDTATMAVVNTADGSLADVHRALLPDDDNEAVARLAELVSGAGDLAVRPDRVFVVGSGVDVSTIKPALEGAASVPVSAAGESDTALARGAALASANAPLFASSTAALAYAQDPGTGAVNPHAVPAGYFADADDGAARLAYSADSDQDADAAVSRFTSETFPSGAATIERPNSQPFLAAMAVLTIIVVGMVSLALSLAVSIRPHANDRPPLGQKAVVPTRQTPAPPPPKTRPPARPAPAPSPAPSPTPRSATRRSSGTSAKTRSGASSAACAAATCSSAAGASAAATEPESAPAGSADLTVRRRSRRRGLGPWSRPRRPRWRARRPGYPSAAPDPWPSPRHRLLASAPTTCHDGGRSTL